METVSTGFGMWFYFMIALPVIFYFFVALLNALPDGQTTKAPAPTAQKRPTSNTFSAPYIEVNLKFPNITAPKQSRPKTRQTPKKRKPQQKKRKSQPIRKPVASKPVAPKKQAISTDNRIISDVVSGLSNLGIKKSQAKELVNSLCKKKKYNSTESLLNACFVYIRSD